MSRYIRRSFFELIDKNAMWNARGCNCYTVFNEGNVNVTVNGVHVLLPGMFYSSPNESPEVEDWSEIHLQFDLVNEPKTVAPDTGPNPEQREYDPATDPAPAKDPRVVIMKSFISPKDFK